jgi:hypothetical protein
MKNKNEMKGEKKQNEKDKRTYKTKKGKEEKKLKKIKGGNESRLIKTQRRLGRSKTPRRGEREHETQHKGKEEDKKITEKM